MENITVVIPIAPIPTNPDSIVIDETMQSIRERLPESEIILMFDGIPAWKEEMRPAYEEFTNKMLWRCEHELHKVSALVFEEHSHQTLMTKQALTHVKTPLILWSEQDTPLSGAIPFKELSEVILTGYANVIRFHHEATIHPEHEELMLDKKPIEILGQPFLRTRQWSGRPHLASTKFYKKIAEVWEEPKFIEHEMYGVVVNGPYDEHRLHMFAPEGTLVRSLHTDGRRRGADHYDPSAS